MRVRISPPCSSETMRPCWVSRFWASRVWVASRPCTLATSELVSASAREYCWIDE